MLFEPEGQRAGDLEDGDMVLRHHGRLVAFQVKCASMTAPWHQDLLCFQTLTESEAG